MIRQYEILIVGAGMVGLSLAALLSKNDRLSVTLIDLAERPTFRPEDDISLRVSALSPGSIEILKRVNAWQEIMEIRVCPYRDMKVWDAAGSVDGPETLCFDAAEFALSELGFITENLLIEQALLNQLDGIGASIRYSTDIRQATRSGHRFVLELANGETLTPDLLIGADGADSFVRNAAAMTVRSWSYQQKAFVTCLQPEFNHRHTAWQRFLKEGPIGLLPLVDGRISIVWSTTPKMAEDLLGLPDQALAKILTEVTDGVLGKLTPTGPRATFPLKSQYALNYVQDGLALVGDAAHTVHPLAGQGANLGFADAASLAHTIDQAVSSDENPGDLPLLRKYERARKGKNLAMLGFLHGLNSLFSNESMPLARLRGFGMYLFNRSGLIRGRAVEYALGIR